MQVKRFVCLILTTLVAGLAGTAGAQPGTVSDEEIQLAIEGELWEARAIDANRLDVRVDDGIARLSGTVDSILSEERALRVAEMTRGVVSVVDEIDVAASGRSDAAIRQDVIAALRSDPAADSWEIAATVDDGVVTLTGNVESYAESKLSERIAGSVYGVRDIDNLIVTAAPESRSDGEIQAEIEEMFEWNVRLDDALVNVEVDNGDVTLAGSVGSDYEKRLAESMAHVAGVSSVDADGLEVEWWLRDDMQRDTAWEDLSDEEIRNAVIRAMAYDTRVNSFNVGVSTEDGAVTLTGVVDNLKAKRAAAQDAHNTVGVWRVKNYVKVRPVVARADTEIADDIRNALARDPLVNSADITLVVDTGEAHLYGSVDSQFEREHAEDIATRINGVVEVRNYLSVAYDAPRYSYDYRDWDPWLYDYDFDYESVQRKSDAEIIADIESELFWSPYVDADQVRVSVEDGVATLSGSVDSIHERRLAAQNALEGGAYRVVNRLDVDRS